MKRASGVLMHISSLPGEYSEGSFGKNAEKFIDFLAACGFSYWQVLPFCMPDEYNSPYKSYSAFSGNPNFIDLDILAQKGLLKEEELAAARQRTPYSCEFERLAKERVPLLARAAARFTDDGAMEKFLATHPHVKKFCLFMAYKASNNDLPWNEWTNGVYDETAYRTWAFIQYEFFAQWDRIRDYAHKKNIRLIGDLPIYVAYDSADVWSNPALFELDEDNLPKFVAGVPPDYFSEDGQLWGNPLYNWQEMKKQGYAWWSERIRHMLSMFDGIRIDHFRGFDTYYSIPYGAPNARKGKWRQGPGREFIDCIRKTAADRLILAEDLGELMPSVQELLRYSGFPGMRVFQFGFLDESESKHLPHNYEENCIAYTGTHDNNTLLGYIWELDEKTRQELLHYCGYFGADWNGGYDNILRVMFESHAGIVIFPVQDLLLFGEDTRLNIPGTGTGNWGYRVTAEQLASIDTARFAEFNRLYRRQNTARSESEES